jgi:hypothetical protein
MGITQRSLIFIKYTVYTVFTDIQYLYSIGISIFIKFGQSEFVKSTISFWSFSFFSTFVCSSVFLLAFLFFSRSIAAGNRLARRSLSDFDRSDFNLSPSLNIFNFGRFVLEDFGRFVAFLVLR